MGVAEAIEGIGKLDRMWRKEVIHGIASQYVRGFVDPDKIEPATPQNRERNELIALTIREMIRRSEPIYVAPPICEIIGQTFETLPDFHVTPSDLPCPNGVIWFAEPIPILNRKYAEDRGYVWDDDDDVETMSLRAVAFHNWGELPPGGAGWTVNGVNSAHPAEQPGLAIAHYLEATGGERRRAGIDVMYLHGYVVPWGESWQTIAPVVARRKELSLVLTAVTLTAFAFMQQKIAHVARESVKNKNAARRLRADTGRDTATVVLLRRTERGDHEPHTPRAVDWQVQWLVGGMIGHWRNHYYPSTGEHKPLYIAPFWKGPKDKPMKIGTRVYKVAR